MLVKQRIVPVQVMLYVVQHKYVRGTCLRAELLCVTGTIDTLVMIIVRRAG